WSRAAEQRDSSDVGRHQIGRELDALEFDVEDERQGAYQQRLRRPGHTFEQHVAAGEQAHERLARGRLLSQNHSVERLYNPARVVRWRSSSHTSRSEEHTSELQSRFDLVCRLLLEKKK